MKKTYIGLILIGILFGSSIIAYIFFLENFFNGNDNIQPPSPSGPIIINHTCAHLEDLKSIPDEWILEAKKTLNIAYGHTSHGSQLISGGMANMEAFMARGDFYSYGSDGGGNDAKLEFYDFSGGFGGSLTTTTAHNLGNPNDNAWRQATEEYLDNPANPGTNVVIWSWCQINGHPISTYLSNMEDLISAYAPGGSKGRTNETKVTFVFMTGHVNGDGDGGTTYDQNQEIRNHCIQYNRTLYDFADIEKYDPNDNYFGDKNVNDDCSYTGGNWATEWQNTHLEMTSPTDFANTEPNGGEWYQCSPAHTRPLNGNLKAYGAWFLFARLAGWNGN